MSFRLLKTYGTMIVVIVSVAASVTLVASHKNELDDQECIFVDEFFSPPKAYLIKEGDWYTYSHQLSYRDNNGQLHYTPVAQVIHNPSDEEKKKYLKGEVQ